MLSSPRWFVLVKLEKQSIQFGCGIYSAIFPLRVIKVEIIFRGPTCKHSLFGDEFMTGSHVTFTFQIIMTFFGIIDSVGIIMVWYITADFLPGESRKKGEM